MMFIFVMIIVVLGIIAGIWNAVIEVMQCLLSLAILLQYSLNYPRVMFSETRSIPKEWSWTC
jgi:hypothetical protein